MLKVGFVGLGAMGWSMAGHLHRAGLLVAVANRTPEKAARFADEYLGVQAVTDAGALASMCDVVISSVTADADVLALARDLAAQAVPGFVLLDTSTIASGSAQRAAAQLRAVGADFIDAPVSGGVEGARNGKLSVMAGGDAATLERVRPAVETFAARITLMGDVRLYTGENVFQGGHRGKTLVFDARTGLLDLDGKSFPSGMPKYAPCTKNCKPL